MANKTNRPTCDEPGRPRASVGTCSGFIAVDADEQLRRIRAERLGDRASATVASCCSPSREGLGRPEIDARPTTTTRCRCCRCSPVPAPDDPARGWHHDMSCCRGRSALPARAQRIRRCWLQVQKVGRERGQAACRRPSALAQRLCRQLPAPGGRGRGRALNPLPAVSGKDLRHQRAEPSPTPRARTCPACLAAAADVPLRRRPGAVRSGGGAREAAAQGKIREAHFAHLVVQWHAAPAGLRSRERDRRRLRMASARDRDPARARLCRPYALERLEAETPTPKWTVLQTLLTERLSALLARTGRSR